MCKNSSDKFQEEIEKVVSYFSEEFSVTFCEAVGVLEIVKHNIIDQMLENNEPGEEQ